MVQQQHKLISIIDLHDTSEFTYQTKIFNTQKSRQHS